MDEARDELDAADPHLVRAVAVDGLDPPVQEHGLPFPEIADVEDVGDGVGDALVQRPGALALLECPP